MIAIFVKKTTCREACQDMVAIEILSHIEIANYHSVSLNRLLTLLSPLIWLSPNLISKAKV